MESLTKIALRQFKRAIGETICLDDYDQIWAETTENGAVVQNSITDRPLYMIVAARTGKDEWNVTKVKRFDLTKDEIILHRPGTDFLDILAATPPITPFEYKTLVPSVKMTSEEVIGLMKLSDPNPRQAQQHYTRALGFTPAGA